MHDIDDLIEFHNECEFLDFKQEEYNELNKPHLIKDVLAFANAAIIGNRYIIIGVKKNDGVTELFNIESKLDSANIQQYVHANITPELSVDYAPYQYKGFNLMVITIQSPESQPYMVEKDVSYKKGAVCLKANECWVRKGSYQIAATRKDFDRMYALGASKESFKGKLDITFAGTDLDVITLKALKDLKLPSRENAKELEMIIAKKEDMQKNNPFDYKLSIRNPMFPWNGTSYEERDLETLRKNLKNVAKTYQDEDYYTIFEKHAFKLNLEIFNSGDTYLEDATVELIIPNLDKILVADRIHYVHRASSNPLLPSRARTITYDELNYPLVKEDDQNYIVTETIGNIKHNIKQQGFKVPIRLAIGKIEHDTELKILCKIFGKNLTLPIEKELVISIKC